MTYCTLTDLLDRAGNQELLDVADRDGDGVIDQSVVDAAIRHADNLIDGYLAGRFTLPLSSAPDLVNTWAVAIARYHLHRDGPPDYVVKDYDRAIASLKDVQAGRLSLPVPGASAPAATPSGQMLGSFPDQVFTPEKLAGW